ncbi:cytochrome b [Zavarzinia sp.]|uniref:cytochrome b n=1 Tax=Zavarzinia sp. TaxID=2027920 RepID=UPI00356A495A
MTSAFTPVHPVIRAIHWSVVALLIALFAIAWSIDFFEPGALKASVVAVHRSLGLIVLVLAVIRPLARIVIGMPPAEPAPPLAALAAKALHLALYAAIIVMPLAGWIATNANGYPADIFGIPVPTLTAKDEGLADLAFEAHEVLGNLIVAAVVLHVAAALWHHVILRDNTLRRMLPTRS